MAMAITVAGKQKNEFWSELSYKGSCFVVLGGLCMPMGVLYALAGTIQPRTANMAAY